MFTVTPESEALRLLRAIFDLAEADVRPTAELLVRLSGYDAPAQSTLLQQLRRAGLLQLDTLGLTMAGLVVATRLPPFQPRPLRARPPVAAVPATVRAA